MSTESGGCVIVTSVDADETISVENRVYQVQTLSRNRKRRNRWGITSLELAEKFGNRTKLVEGIKNMDNIVTFIPNAGGCIVSKNILEEKGKLKWCIREESVNPVDNGWRFLSDIDTDEFLDDPDNMCIVDFNKVANIEPAVLSIYDCPIGTDIELVEKGRKKYFRDSNTGKKFVP